MNAIKRARSDAELTLQQLSDESGVPVETLSRLENDKRKPHVKTLAKIAEALGLPVSELAKDEDRVEVLVGVYMGYPNPEFIGERLNFRGKQIGNWEDAGGDIKLTLYECPNGYRVHFVENVDGDLLPKRKNPDTGEFEYLTYPAAEDVVEEHPEFRDTLGLFPVRYLD